MKKIMSIVLCLSLVFMMSGCGKVHSPFVFDTGSSTESELPIGHGYRIAIFDKYNSLASENGLGGEKICVKGTLGEVQILEGEGYSYLEQSDGNEWILIYGVASDIDLTKIEESFVSKEITTYGVYTGFSRTKQCPVIELDKFEYDEKDYTVLDLAIEETSSSSDEAPESLDDTSSETSSNASSEPPKEVKPPNSKEETKEKPTESKKDEIITSSVNTSSITTGQKNALSKAKSYLDFMAFSYQGLIKQLEYDKFSHDDAVYGADNCNADWNEQAARKGKSYLEIMPFSRDALIDQLIFDEFTSEQAAHGAQANGY